MGLGTYFKILEAAILIQKVGHFYFNRRCSRLGLGLSWPKTASSPERGPDNGATAPAQADWMMSSPL